MLLVILLKINIMISILKLKRMLGYLKHYYYDYDPSEFGQYGL